MGSGRTWLPWSRQPSFAMKRFQTLHSSAVHSEPWACAQVSTDSSVSPARARLLISQARAFRLIVASQIEFIALHDSTG